MNQRSNERVFKKMPKIIPELEKKILDAAVAVFLQVGYHKADIRAIAAEAGISVGSIYSHFHSKSDLFLSVTQVWRESLREDVQEIFNSASSAQEKLLQLSTLLMSAVGERHGLWRDFFTDREVLKRAEIGKQLMQEMEKDWQKFSKTIEQLILDAKPGPGFERLAMNFPGRMALAFRALVSFLPISFPDEPKKNKDFIKTFMEVIFYEK